MVHRRPVYIYLLNVPSFSSRYFNKIKRTSRLGRLLALSLEILKLLCKSLKTSVPFQFYPQNILRIYDSHFAPILTLRTYNSGIVPRKVRILTLSANLGILTLRRAIPELSRLSLCAEHIYPYFVYADSKGSGESAHLQDLSEPSFLDTAISSVLAHLIYSLLLVILFFA